MKLYLDLDGVMADFDKHYADSFGKNPKGTSDQELWTNIDSHPMFFRSLPLCKDAQYLFSWLKERYDVTILTACPKHDYAPAAIQKRQWVREHLCVDTPVIPMLGGKNKALFMHEPGDILIDDFIKNCRAWTKLGGIAIVHKNVEDTIRELEELSASS